MKKLLLIISVALFAMSCQGPQGIPGRDGFTYNKTVDFTVQSNDWKKMTDAGGAFIGWQYIIDMPELTKSVFERGVCIVSLWEGKNIQKPLPVVVYNETDGQKWQAQIWNDKGVGSVGVYYQEDDFANENHKPSTLTFHIQILM